LLADFTKGMEIAGLLLLFARLGKYFCSSRLSTGKLFQPAVISQQCSQHLTPWPFGEEFSREIKCFHSFRFLAIFCLCFLSDLFRERPRCQMLATLLADHGWLEKLASTQPRAAEIFSKSPEQQKKAGYFHTLREICQQPATWIKTAEQ